MMSITSEDNSVISNFILLCAKNFQDFLKINIMYIIDD